MVDVNNPFMIIRDYR